MLISPGDHVLVESPMYSGALAILKPTDCKLVAVQTDHHGIIPQSLSQVLESYGDRAADLKPKVRFNFI